MTAKSLPSSSGSTKTCGDCDRELVPGEAVRCDPCQRDWQLETDHLLEESKTC